MQDWRLFAASHGWRTCPILTQPKRWLNLKGLKVCFVQSRSAPAFLYSFILLFLLDYVDLLPLKCWGCIRILSRWPRSELSLEGQSRIQALFAMTHGGRAQLNQNAEWLCWKCSCVMLWMSLAWKESIQRWCARSIHFCKHQKPPDSVPVESHPCQLGWAHNAWMQEITMAQFSWIQFTSYWGRRKKLEHN